MALAKPPVWPPSSCHWIRNAVNSAVLTAASQAAIPSNGFGKEAPVFKLQEIRTEIDREIQTTPVSSLFMPRWGEQTIPVLHHNCYRFGKEMQAGNADHKYPLTSSTLHFLHSTWHPSILPHLSSPGPTFTFLNSTPDLLGSKCIPRGAPSIQEHSLPAPSFTPDYTWATTLRLLHFPVPKRKTVY